MYMMFFVECAGVCYEVYSCHGDHRVAEIDSLQTEMTQLKMNQTTKDEVPFSPAGPLLSEPDM